MDPFQFGIFYSSMILAKNIVCSQYVIRQILKKRYSLIHMIQTKYHKIKKALSVQVIFSRKEETLTLVLFLNNNSINIL